MDRVNRLSGKYGQLRSLGDSLPIKIIRYLQRDNIKSFLVGGAVRDILLKRKIIDYDIATFSPPGRFIKNLAQVTNARIIQYPQFLTASLFLKNGLRIDFSQMRSEFYPQPAHLPTVLPSNLLWDLFRRDFTINSIAVSLNKDDFGRIIDPFNGVGDIKRRILRVIHNKSFQDDPTRLFRLLRYKIRLGFKIEDKTRQLMNEAIKNGYHLLLSGERIKNELILIMNEKKWREILAELRNFNLVHLSDSKTKFLMKIKRNRLLYLLASIRDSYRSSIPLSKTEQKIINEIKTITQIIYRLKRARTKSQIFFILSQKLDQTIGILYDIGSNGIKRKISIYNRIKETKPFITGKDLVKFHLPAGRSYHYILKRLYAAQLDKRIRGRKEAIIWFERLKWKSSLISRQS